MALNIFQSNSPEDTSDLAKCFAGILRGGEIFLLEGPIGAGKTYFTRELAKALGIKKLPSSASFGMMRTYNGKLKLYHFDLFRAGEDDMENLGIEEFFGNEDGVTVMEWSQAAMSLAEKTGYIGLNFQLAGGDKRKIKTSARGDASKKVLTAAKDIWQKIKK